MVLLIAVTATENPFFSGVAPLRACSLVLQLHRCAMTACGRLSARVVADPRDLGGAVALTRPSRRWGFGDRYKRIFAILYARR
jgi:replication-associated recombination protein RarA